MILIFQNVNRVQFATVVVSNSTTTNWKNEWIVRTLSNKWNQKEDSRKKIMIMKLVAQPAIKKYVNIVYVTGWQAIFVTTLCNLPLGKL